MSATLDKRTARKRIYQAWIDAVSVSRLASAASAGLVNAAKQAALAETGSDTAYAARLTAAAGEISSAVSSALATPTVSNGYTVMMSSGVAAGQEIEKNLLQPWTLLPVSGTTFFDKLSTLSMLNLYRSQHPAATGLYHREFVAALRSTTWYWQIHKLALQTYAALVRIGFTSDRKTEMNALAVAGAAEDGGDPVYAAYQAAAGAFTLAHRYIPSTFGAAQTLMNTLGDAEDALEKCRIPAKTVRPDETTKNVDSGSLVYKF